MRHPSPIVTATVCSLAALGGCSDDSAPASPNTPAPLTVRVAYCNGLQPSWLAFQDGDGAWTRAMPVSTGDTITYQYVFQATRAGMATMSPGGGGLTDVEVLFGAPAEIATAGNTKTVYCGDPVSKALLGTAIGLDTNESAVIGAHLSRTAAVPQTGGDFALSGLGSGPHDLIAARHSRASGRTTVTSIIVRRGIDQPDSAVMPVLDFESAEAILPISATLTLNGLGPEGATAVVRVLTKTSEVLLSPIVTASLDVARPYAALPLDDLRGDDIQEILVSALNGSVSRTTEFYFTAPGSRTLAIPAALVRPTFDTVATTPALRLRARFVPQTDFDREAYIRYQQGTTTLVGVAMTAAYAALIPNGYELVVPDLSGAAGFNPAWALHPGAETIWTAARVGGTVARGANAIPAEGSLRRSAFDTDTIPGP